jgi:phosphoglycolate phosphatase-like HAD superfamily hydrolase
LVIFDLDGTLTDSAPGVVASFRHALDAVGAEIPDGDLAVLVVGPPMHHTMSALGLGERAADAVAAYRADYTSRGWAMNTLFDAVVPLLTDLRAAGVRLAVATSKAEPIARRILDHFGIAAHFEVIAGASPDGVRAAKPDGDGRRPRPRRRRRRRTRHPHRGGRVGLRAPRRHRCGGRAGGDRR